MTDLAALDSTASTMLAGAPWALVTYRTPKDPFRTGVLTPEGVREIGDLGHESLVGLVKRWDEVVSAITGLVVGRLPLAGDVELDVPLRLPSKILCAGANYHGHLREMGVPSPADDVRPYFFFKPPSTTVVADGTPVPIEMPSEAQMDWEAELAVVIGRRASRVSRAAAMDVVAGYVVINDITDRSRLARDPALAPPFAFDWVSAKARDASCPIGPAFVPSQLVEDPHALGIRLWVNGELKQDASTADMIYDIPTLIEAASEIVTLEPGDLIATGTPAGVGKPRGEFLKPGDLVTAEVTGVGRVTNPIVARAA